MLAEANSDAALQRLAAGLRKAGYRATRFMVVDVVSSAAAARPAKPQPRSIALRSAMEGEISALNLELGRAWCEVFGDKAATAQDAISIAWEGGSPQAKRLDLALREMAKSTGAPLTPKRLGHWLRRLGGGRIDGNCFVRVGERDHTSLWRLILDKR